MPPALVDRSFCIYITTTGRVDGLVGLVYRRSAWQNWLALFIRTNDARRYTLRLRFLISCVDLSPRPQRAQETGCLGIASALLCFVSALIYILFALFIYTRCTAFPMLQSTIKQAGHALFHSIPCGWRHHLATMHTYIALERTNRAKRITNGQCFFFSIGCSTRFSLRGK